MGYRTDVVVAAAFDLESTRAGRARGCSGRSAQLRPRHVDCCGV